MPPCCWRRRLRCTPRILDLAQASAATGEPILRLLAYGFPDGGYEDVKDQFLMGDDRRSPYGSHLMNSYCHAWSCTPTRFLRRKTP